METLPPIPEKFSPILQRVLELSQSDERISAVTLCGSYAQGTADENSDLDLFILVTDEAYEEFLAERTNFVRQVNEPFFVEVFDSKDYVFTIHPGGAEVEIGIGRESDVGRMHIGPFKILLDKKNLMADVVIPSPAADLEDNLELLRQQIYWFWHDCSHFIAAVSRNHLWWAQGQLEALRHYAATLARLKYNFSDPYIDDEIYFKIELLLPEENLEPLWDTFSPMDKAKITQAAWVIVRYYQAVVPELAQTHGIPYPAELASEMIERLAKLGQEDD